MQESELAEFYRALGHRVIRTRSCFWVSAGPLQFKSLPDHKIVTPSAGELAKVMVLGPAAAVRYASESTAARTNGTLYVCSNRDYDLSSLSQNARSRTRRGLARCRVERIDFTCIVRHGYGLALDTHLRQTGKPLGMTCKGWESYWEKAAQLSDFEAWGAFVGEKLAAFTVTCLVEECLLIYRGASSAELVKFYPNEALLFTVVKSGLASPKVGYVSSGLKPLASSEGLDYFKISMGFTPSPLNDRVVFNPLIGPLLAWPGAALASRLAKLNPRRLFWRKLSAAIRLNKDSAAGLAAKAGERGVNPA
jgi:hypothetical protein